MGGGRAPGAGSFAVREGWLVTRSSDSGSTRCHWCCLRSDGAVWLLPSQHCTQPAGQVLQLGKETTLRLVPAREGSAGAALLVGPLTCWSPDKILGSWDLQDWLFQLEEVRRECAPLALAVEDESLREDSRLPVQEHTPPRQDSVSFPRRPTDLIAYLGKGQVAARPLFPRRQSSQRESTPIPTPTPGSERSVRADVLLCLPDLRMSLGLV